MEIRIGSGQFFADGFTIRRSFSLEEGETRLISYLSDKGCGASPVTLSDGNLLTGGRIGVIRWTWGAELYPLPAISPWEAVAEKEVSLSGGVATVAVRAGDPAELRVTGEATYLHIPAPALYAPRISVIEGQRFPIVRVDAKCEEGDYLLLLSLIDSTCSILIEEVGDRIFSEGNEVRVERRCRDSLSRRVTTRYLWRGDRFETSREIVCANEHIFTREERGFALLEAAAAKDEGAITALLSPEIGDAGAVIDYFGAILSVRSAASPDRPTAAAAITRDAEGLVGTIYDFDFDPFGRIENIRRE